MTNPTRKKSGSNSFVCFFHSGSPGVGVRIGKWKAKRKKDYEEGEKEQKVKKFVSWTTFENLDETKHNVNIEVIPNGWNWPQRSNWLYAWKVNTSPDHIFWVNVSQVKYFVKTKNTKHGLSYINNIVHLWVVWGLHIYLQWCPSFETSFAKIKWV